MEVKICIIGDTDVGKTSLSMRYCHGDFPENSTPTIGRTGSILINFTSAFFIRQYLTRAMTLTGASFLQRRVVVDTKEIALQIWDTAGQERFRSMAPMYYRGAKGAVCVFDVTNKASFARVQQWLRDLKCHSDPNVVVCIAGNKCDQEAAFDLAECEEVASSSGAVFVKTSALTGEGVDLIFQELSRGIADTFCNKERSLSSNSADGRVKVGDKGVCGDNKQQSSCC